MDYDRQEQKPLSRAIIEAGQVKTLCLGSVYFNNIDTAIYNSLYNRYFVHDFEDYDRFHNSNHEVARWLQDLGCQVRGPALPSNWKIEEPE